MNIIVTGASKGIGYQTVLKLLQTGNHHILAISRDIDGLKKLENEFDLLTESKLDCFSFDLSQKDYTLLLDCINNVFELEKGNSIDVLLNNAGLLTNKLFIDLDEDDWQKTFEVNVFAIVRLVKLLFPYFNRNKGSHIVNIGSMGGIQGSEKYPGLSAYSASKGAVNILTESMAKEFEKENIRVNSINPGGVQTEMFDKAFPGIKARMQAPEIAEYIAHFCIHGQKYLNGRLHQLGL